jgi:hypothetical protein
VAGPIRLRRSTAGWSEQRARSSLLEPLDAKFGATLTRPDIDPPKAFEARRLEMDNDDIALFAWGEEAAYWLGNTETPETLWRTEKYTFEEVPFPLARWAQRELLAQLDREAPWLTDFRYLAWFFLPVLFSKDGRESTRAFFREDAAGFPDADRAAALGFYDDFLKTGLLEAHRYTMASKLGTSEVNDFGRMRATMGEFDAAKLLADAGLEFTPEPELDSGHALDFRVSTAADSTLVEVTRPSAPRNRTAGTATAALRQTVDAKTRDQLDIHAGALLLVDCSSFRDDEWATLRAEHPPVAYEPTVVFRMRPDGRCEGYRRGSVPLELDDGIEWV